MKYQKSHHKNLNQSFVQKNQQPHQLNQPHQPHQPQQPHPHKQILILTKKTKKIKQGTKQLILKKTRI